MITKSDLHEIGLLALADVTDENIGEFVIRGTSGTTGGQPLLIVRQRKHVDFPHATLYNIALFFGSYNARLSNLTSQLFSFKNMNAVAFTKDDFNSELPRLLREIEVDAIIGFPSVVVKALLLVMGDDEKILKNVRVANFIGEPLSALHRKIIKGKLPNADISCIYSAAEIGFISRYPCRYLSLGEYHPSHGVGLEIAFPDELGIGEIIVSFPLSSSVYVEKYAIGDMGRILRRGCLCGEKVIFEVLGRKDFDFIKLSGVILRQEMFERAFIPFEHLVRDFRGEAEEVSVDGKICASITISVVLTPRTPLETSVSYARFIEENISKRLFLTPQKTLDDLVREGLFLPLKVMIVETLEEKHKSVKIRKII